jgi:hypothetical protein
VVSTTPRSPYPRERPGTRCTGSWVGPRTGLDVCEKSHPTGIRSPDRPARCQSLYRLSYPAHICENVVLQNIPIIYTHPVLLCAFVGILTSIREMYTDILRRLTDAMSRKCPEKWRTSSWFLLHDNAPVHRSVSVKDFLAKNNATTLEYHPHSPDLASTDFFFTVL